MTPEPRRPLAALDDPTTVAVLTMEMQRGVCGDLAALPDLATAVAAAGTAARIGRLCVGARAVGARVIHCTIKSRADRAGRTNNNRLLAATAAQSDSFLPGSPGAELIAELQPAVSDIEVSRLHGLTPFTATSLDQTLRNLGIGTVVCTGVSLNIGVLGMVISASDLGYQVVVPTDAVVGLPDSYAQMLLQNTIGLLATLTTVEEITASWK